MSGSVQAVVSGSPGVSNSCVSPYRYSSVSQSGWCCPTPFVSQSGWWCPALRKSPIHLSPLKAIHLSPSLAGGVRLSGSLQFVCLPLKQYICLPVWLVASGSPDVSISFVSPYSNSLVSQGCWRRPALRMSPFHLSPLMAIHVSPSLAGGVRLSSIAIHLSHSLAGGVRLSGCLQFICLPLQQFMCLPVWLVASGSPDVSNSCVSGGVQTCFPYSNSSVFQSGLWCPALCMSPIHLSPLVVIHSLNSLLLGFSILS